MSSANAIATLWLLPVALQIVLPLGLLVGFFGKRLVETILGKKEVTAHQEHLRQSI